MKQLLIFVCVFIFVFIITCKLMLFIFSYHIADGEKIGSIVKIAKQGLICKTWEGQLIRGGMNQGSGGFGTKPFDFTVEKPEVLIKIQNAMNSSKEVKIKYHKEFFTFCRSESGDYFIDDVEEVK